MAENLNYTGSSIKHITDAGEWESNSYYDGWSYYKNNENFYNLTEEDKPKYIKYLTTWIEKTVDPVINKTVEDMMKIFNFSRKDFMGAKVEKINVSGIFVAKKFDAPVQHTSLVLLSTKDFRWDKSSSPVSLSNFAILHSTLIPNFKSI